MKKLILILLLLTNFNNTCLSISNSTEANTEEVKKVIKSNRPSAIPAKPVLVKEGKKSAVGNAGLGASVSTGVTTGVGSKIGNGVASDRATDVTSRVSSDFAATTTQFQRNYWVEVGILYSSPHYEFQTHGVDESRLGGLGIESSLGYKKSNWFLRGEYLNHNWESGEKALKTSVSNHQLRFWANYQSPLKIFQYGGGLNAGTVLTQVQTELLNQTTRFKGSWHLLYGAGAFAKINFTPFLVASLNANFITSKDFPNDQISEVLLGIAYRFL